MAATRRLGRRTDARSSSTSRFRSSPTSSLLPLACRIQIHAFKLEIEKVNIGLISKGRIREFLQRPQMEPLAKPPLFGGFLLSLGDVPGGSHLRFSQGRSNRTVERTLAR